VSQKLRAVQVPANQIVDLDPCELFVHRNVANLAPPQDANYLSVLQFAVDVLKVKHIMVVGITDVAG
jgi:carbonic anhydrase